MSYNVKLEVFEGPLDLLLHLIKKNKVDIYNIPIALITDQYLEYLEFMKVLNLEIAGEFIVIASTLLYIKSKMLLPIANVDEDEEGEDPAAELKKRLIEYQKYKKAASQLQDMDILDRDIFARKFANNELEELQDGDITIEKIGLFDLLDAFRKVLESKRMEPFHEITLEKITVKEKMIEILERLEKEKSIFFHSMMDGLKSRIEIIVIFLALLELVRLKIIKIYQAIVFGTIKIFPSVEDGGELKKFYERINKIGT